MTFRVKALRPGRQPTTDPATVLSDLVSKTFTEILERGQVHPVIFNQTLRVVKNNLLAWLQGHMIQAICLQVLTNDEKEVKEEYEVQFDYNSRSHAELNGSQIDRSLDRHAQVTAYTLPIIGRYCVRALLIPSAPIKNAAWRRDISAKQFTVRNEELLETWVFGYTVARLLYRSGATAIDQPVFQVKAHRPAQAITSHPKTKLR